MSLVARARSLFVVPLCGLLAAFGVQYSAEGGGPPVGSFQLAATYQVSGEVAEIVAATPDEQTLIYTDSEEEEIGLVDVSDPAEPQELATFGLEGSPTAVDVTPDGIRALVTVNSSPPELVILDISDPANPVEEHSIGLGGQPDSIKVSPDGRFAVVVIENEREDGEADMPDPPPGFLTIVTLDGEPADWTTEDLALTGIADKFAEDPEPEFVDINQDNLAAVTMQENNHIVVVDIETLEVVSDFPAGTTTHAADLEDDDQIVFDDQLTDSRREPDGIVWTPGGRLFTANEGDYTNDLEEGEFVGGRDFTLFTTSGEVVFEPGSTMEEEAAAVGLYDDGRSDNRGSEPEGVEIGSYLNHTFLFVGAERGNYVAVYRLSNERKPKLEQILGTGDRPEGLLALPGRGLFVTANEGDGTISIFVGSPGSSRR